MFSHYLISRPATITSFPLLTFGQCPNWLLQVYRFTGGIGLCLNYCSQTCSAVFCMTLISSLLFAGHIFALLCHNSQIWSGDQLRKANSFVMSLLAVILSQTSVCGWGFHNADFNSLFDRQIIKEDQSFIIMTWLSPIFLYSWPNKNVKHFFRSVHIQFKSVHRKAQHEPNHKCPSLLFAQIWASTSCVLSCGGNWPQRGEKRLHRASFNVHIMKANYKTHQYDAKMKESK